VVVAQYSTRWPEDEALRGMSGAPVVEGQVGKQWTGRAVALM
jgi:hypothetical protein